MSEDITTTFYRIDEQQDGDVNAPNHASLLLVGGESNGEIFDLIEGDISLGRQDENKICLDDSGVSRWHCCFKVEGDNVSIKDLGSRNGTYINNHPITESVYLHKGDIIKVGPVVLKYLPKGDVERVFLGDLNRKANTDGLTECYNKDYFNKELDRLVERALPKDSNLSLIIFDLDLFKNLNDSYGHDAGDQVLKQLAELIRKKDIRANDIFARYGGEEFVVLLPGTTLIIAEMMAERFRREVEHQEFTADGEKLKVTISVGTANLSQGLSSSSSLFRAADRALYQAKAEGRNRVITYQPESLNLSP